MKRGIPLWLPVFLMRRLCRRMEHRTRIHQPSILLRKKRILWSKDLSKRQLDFKIETVNRFSLFPFFFPRKKENWRDYKRNKRQGGRYTDKITTYQQAMVLLQNPHLCKRWNIAWLDRLCFSQRIHKAVKTIAHSYSPQIVHWPRKELPQIRKTVPMVNKLQIARILSFPLGKGEVYWCSLPVCRTSVD